MILGLMLFRCLAGLPGFNTELSHSAIELLSHFKLLSHF